MQNRSARQQYGQNRPAAAMWIALVALATCSTIAVAIGYASSLTATQVRNASMSAAARDAATTGLTLGLARMSSLDWTGLRDSLDGVVDSERGSAYAVTYEAVADDPLGVIIRSVGTAGTAPRTRTVRRRAIVRLQPRFGDDASDVEPLPIAYEPFNDHSVIVTNSSGEVPLGPATAFDGDVHTHDPIGVFDGLNLTAAQLADLETGLGQLATASGWRPPPHPLAGGLTTDVSASVARRAANSRLGITSSVASAGFIPTIWPSHTASYQIYEHGPTYSAQEVGATLRDETFGPSPSNPLGIFYRLGNVRVRENVTVHGTLAASSIIVRGENIKLGGLSLPNVFDNSSTGSQLPVLVCDSLRFARGACGSIDGSIRCSGLVERDGRAHREVVGTPVDFIHLASVSAGSRLHCVLGFGTGVDVSVLKPSEHELYVHDGVTGSPVEIVSTDPSSRTVEIVAQFHVGKSVTCQAIVRRHRAVRIRGQILADDFVATVPTEWQLKAAHWTDLHQQWAADDAASQSSGGPAIWFHEWLANPLNHAPFSAIHSHTFSANHGLNLRPTFHVSRSDHARVFWQTPLFRPEPGPDTRTAGYRWRVVAWDLFDD